MRQVREEFRARDLHRDLLLVSIDLAEAHVALGEMATALQLLGEMTPTMARWNRNGLAVWLMFQKALEERRDLGAAALAPLFENVRLYYRRYWARPERGVLAPVGGDAIPERASPGQCRP